MPINRRIRFEIFKRDKFTCQYCGKKAPAVELHVDHIRPVARGGKDNEENLITACPDCNHGKKAVSLTDEKHSLRSGRRSFVSIETEVFKRVRTLAKKEKRWITAQITFILNEYLNRIGL